LRNQITKVFAIPFVPKLLMGSSLPDRIELPDYFENILSSLSQGGSSPSSQTLETGNAVQVRAPKCLRGVIARLAFISLYFSLLSSATTRHRT
jgi:hypothetical protein